MAAVRPPEAGTLVIAALLLLVLGFAGYWIMQYADPHRVISPWVTAGWFLLAGVLIITAGVLLFLRRSRGANRQ